MTNQELTRDAGTVEERRLVVAAVHDRRVSAGTFAMAERITRTYLVTW